MARPEAVPPTPPTILLVDDRPENLLAMRVMLEGQGYELVTAGSGDEVLRALLRQDFAAILLDVQMPGLDGYETAALIREREQSRNVPIIFCTATEVEWSQMARGYAAGAVDYLVKPVQPELLRAKVAVFAELHAMKQQLLRRLRETQRLNADLARANRAKSDFLSRMSHELRTPMNAILGFAQLLEMGSLTPKQRTGVEHILKAGDHLLQLINEVLDLARIEAGRMTVSPEPVRLGDVLAETLDLVTPLAAPRGIALRSGEGPWWDRHVLADRQRLKQVLLNLLANAVKYNRDGGWVALSVEERAGNRVRVGVADSGPGIAPERQRELFQPFERLGAEATAVEGTGLGLSLVKGLVELMGGTVGVDSAPDQGSRFWIELPLAAAPLAMTARAATDKDQGAKARAEAAGTLLFIEDNLATLRLLEEVLTLRPRITLLSAMQGRLGLELVRSHRPDMVLLDLHLPDLRGEEVLARLQADPRTSEIPVVIYSADVTAGQGQRLVAAGARAFLPKPLDVKLLLAHLDTLIGPPPEQRISPERGQVQFPGTACRGDRRSHLDDRVRAPAPGAAGERRG